MFPPYPYPSSGMTSFGNLLEGETLTKPNWSLGYWGDVAKQMAALKADFPRATTFYITSLENKRTQMVGGRVFEAGLRNAAMRMVDCSHRLATPREEIQYTADARRRIKECAAVEAARRPEAAVGVRVTLPDVPVPPDGRRPVSVLNRLRACLHGLLWRPACQDLEVAAYWRLTRCQQERLHRDIIAWAVAVRLFGGRDIPMRDANWNRFLSWLNPAKAAA